MDSRELESVRGLPLTWFDALAQLRMAPAQRLTMGQQALPIHLEHVKRHFAAYIEDGEAAAIESALVRMANAVRRESGL
ncbi:MAG: hypothetical protein E6I14_08810 [Chloroflexi bacterium]|nr:MAG: hypothetical protein E6I14_08810 [Chloroflexota bacterium]